MHRDGYIEPNSSERVDSRRAYFEKGKALSAFKGAREEILQHRLFFKCISVLQEFYEKHAVLAADLQESLLELNDFEKQASKADLND